MEAIINNEVKELDEMMKREAQAFEETQDETTRIITCDTLRYFDAKHKVTMYDAKGKVKAYAITDEWLAISYIDDKGQEHFIKRA